MEVFLKKQNTIENRVITLTGFNKTRIILIIQIQKIQ
jgi:hypothetical protein